MKKACMTLGLCALALTFTGAAWASDNSTIHSTLPQDKMIQPWEENLKDNVAAHAVLNRQSTGIDYGTDMLGPVDWR